MLNKPTKILIGKDISWNAACVGGAVMTTVQANAAEGEVLVFDKNKVLLNQGSTVADTDTIFIGQVLGLTFDYTPESGAAVTGAKRIIFSDPIEAHRVTNYSGKAYTAKSEQVTTFTLTSAVVTAGTEYLLRIVYKDMLEQTGGGQFVHSYRYTCITGETVDTLGAALMALVNGHGGRRVQATVNAGSDYLILTAKPITSCTTGLTDIDEFRMVEFDAFLNTVATDGEWSKSLATKTTTAAVYGHGTWELVRDAEKANQGYRGFTNQTTFPIQGPAFSTVKSETYDTIIIEHLRGYIAPDNLYHKETPMKTIIYIPNNASANQMDSLLATLNPWMASAALAFAPVGPFTA
jgi:hypothetical protein